MDLIRYVTGEFSVIGGAPVSFFLSIVAVGLLIFYFMSWGYGREISYLRTQLEDYKEKLKGATPQEAKDRIDQLEKQAELVIGKHWTPLAAAEIAQLANAPKPLDNQVKVQLMYENALGKDLAATVYDAFKAAGWTNCTFGAGSGLGSGLTVGVGNGVAPKLKAAIESATQYKVELSRRDEAEWPDLVYLAVGINNAR